MYICSDLFLLFQDSSGHSDCKHVSFKIEYDFDPPQGADFYTPQGADSPISSTPQSSEPLDPLSDYSSLEEIPDYDNVSPWWADLPVDNEANKSRDLDYEHQVSQVVAEKQQKLDREISEKRVNKLKDIISSVGRKRARKRQEDDTSSDDSSTTSGSTTTTTSSSSGSDASKTSVYMTVYYKPCDVKVIYDNMHREGIDWC